MWWIKVTNHPTNLANLLVNWHPLSICKEDIIVDSHEIRYKSRTKTIYEFNITDILQKMHRLLYFTVNQQHHPNHLVVGVECIAFIPHIDLSTYNDMLSGRCICHLIHACHCYTSPRTTNTEKRNKHPFFQEKLLISLFITCENYINIGHKTNLISFLTMPTHNGPFLHTL